MVVTSEALVAGRISVQ